MCVVTSVYTERSTVDVKATRDVVVLQKDVPWLTVFLLDECQNGLRIVTKDTGERYAGRNYSSVKAIEREIFALRSSIL